MDDGGGSGADSDGSAPEDAGDTGGYTADDITIDPETGEGILPDGTRVNPDTGEVIGNVELNLPESNLPLGEADEEDDSPF